MELISDAILKNLIIKGDIFRFILNVDLNINSEIIVFQLIYIL